MFYGAPCIYISPQSQQSANNNNINNSKKYKQKITKK